jgi:hypothetical protein
MNTQMFVIMHQISLLQMLDDFLNFQLLSRASVGITNLVEVVILILNMQDQLIGCGAVMRYTFQLLKGNLPLDRIWLFDIVNEMSGHHQDTLLVYEPLVLLLH